MCRHIREVTADIRRYEPELRRLGQRVAIIIMTDGEPSDGNLVAAMAPLRDLPVWVVVRLCTDEDRVVDFWNNIDNELELNMDVLDDMAGEAEDINKANPWLSYTEPFHRMREFGVHTKEFDLLDEQRLSADHIRFVCSLLFNVRVDSIPHPVADHEEFKKWVAVQNATSGETFSLGLRKMAPPVIVSGMGGSRRESCVVM